MRTSNPLSTLGFAAVILSAAVGSSAQTEETRAPDRQVAYEPPVITFDPSGVPIVEAVRLTLEHDPNIKLQEAATSLQEGVAQEQRGVFDYTLIGDIFYEYRQQELPQSRKDIEQTKRDKLAEGIEANRDAVAEAEQLARALDAVLKAPPGSAQVQAIPDPFLRAQIEIIDTLIADTTSPAAAADLLKVRNDLLNDTITQIQAGGEELVAQFEGAQLRLDNLGGTPSDEVFYNGRFNLQLAKLFRTGINIAPFFNSSVEGTNFKGKPRDVDFGGKGLEDLYNFRVGFNVVVPILRGRGSDATGAAERAANIDYTASLHSLQFQSSLSVLTTALAYWDVRAAQTGLDITERSYELQQQLVELTQGRIDAGELAQVELARAQASEARARARVENARQSLIQARIALAIAMGIHSTDDERTLPTARDDFPQVPGEAALSDQEVLALATEAINRREDLIAAKFLEDSGMILLRSAETDRRPLLDLTSGVWWTALDERSISNATDRWVGPSAKFQLNFQKPISNDTFEGRVVQRAADLSRRSITSVDLQRVIQLSIVRAARSLDQAAERVRQAMRSTEAFQETVTAEFERFRSGDSTLIDAVLTEDQLLQARQALISAQAEYARLLAELRFESGRLVEHGPGGSSVGQVDLLTVPRSGSRR